MNIAKKIYIIISVFPSIIFAGLWIWLQSLEGWGAGAAAILLMWPISMSALFTAIGILLVFFTKRRQQKITSLIFATVLSSLPFLWFIYKWLMDELR